MARWKLTRLTFGNEEFSFKQGDKVTLGRAVSNTISISSIVVSRNHCVINVEADKVLITDLKSSNGVYVGLKKIAPNKPYALTDSEIIGIGWTEGAPVANINNNEKYMFKLCRETSPPIASRITYQNNDHYSDIDLLKESKPKLAIGSESPILGTKPPAKRKLESSNDNIRVKEETDKNTKIPTGSEVINLLSDSENEAPIHKDNFSKKQKLDPIYENFPDETKEECIKTEKDDEYDPFKVKQEYLAYDDEPIQIDSDSDDGESVNWRIRLSQSSPGKPLTKVPRENKMEEESSYSQIDDYDENLEEEHNMNDLITIPPQPPQTDIAEQNKISSAEQNIEDEDFLNDMISLEPKGLYPTKCAIVSERNIQLPMIDVVDGANKTAENMELETNAVATIQSESDTVKKAQLIEPLVQMQRSKFSKTTESKHKSSSHKHSKGKTTSTSRKHISESQKQERKNKLKEIANKEREENEQRLKSPTGSTKPVVNAKVSNTNRGAFLTDMVPEIVKHTKKKEKRETSKRDNKEKNERTSSKSKTASLTEDIENKKKPETKTTSDGDIGVEKKNEQPKTTEHKSTKSKEKRHSHKSKSSHEKSSKSSAQIESRIPLKSLKPLTESEESFSGKPFSKVEPLPHNKPRKSVRFSDSPPMVHIFEIEEGNKLKKTSLVKTTLVDMRQTPVFSLEKITLMKILRWNPQWLEEQINNDLPPPILGNNSQAMAMFHNFSDHNQYVQLVGNLLLIEIWECLTQGYMRVRGQDPAIRMQIASLPPVPAQDRCFELFNLSVNVSVPNSEIKKVPRMGEVMLVVFGPNNANKRFFYVHNVRCLPSPQNNIHSFFCISLHSCYTDKMKTLKPGELMIGLSLVYIQKELMLFEAMDNLALSPLSEAILRPQPRHFVKCEFNPAKYPQSHWTKTLNPSQQVAVHSSVAAALGDRPCIQMVQGPPGTGKSSVICAIVMTYFYDSQMRKQQNRGKLLICATSNAAVDELVCRLLKIRQNLPKAERFRMVRVGRAEAMHPRAHDISSQQLAQRDAAAAAAARHEPAHAHAQIGEEISHLEAKINMWKTQEQDAKDPERAAYCKSRVNQLVSRLSLLRGGSGGGGGAGGKGGAEWGPEQLAAAERRIIEGADIIVTTLGSAHNHKMRGLRRRIALCIVDEAGQAIEPETLIPLTLDVTRLTLIGDPQQLPGFICSQRAKKLGLGESLFSRLTSCTEHWPGGPPVVLLNQQYRMQPDIADYPNRAFYAGRIQSVAPIRPNLEIPSYSIVAISSGDKGQGASGANEMESWGVSRIVLALNSILRSMNLSLAVITPYNAHKELIKKNLRLLQDPSEAPVEVNTVDSFQGQERDVVVASLARSSGVGFLQDAGRINVMLTRARHALLVCLNPHAMLRNNQWRTLVEDAQRRNLYRTFPNKLCQGLSAGQISHNDILKYISQRNPTANDAR